MKKLSKHYLYLSSNKEIDPELVKISASEENKNLCGKRTFPKIKKKIISGKYGNICLNEG